MPRRTVLVLATAVAMLLALPASSAFAAPDTVINFSEISNNTTVHEQYASLGVRFGGASAFGFPAPP
ncbi:MAG: hypothetical protein ABUM26_04175, partial [Solirubrobacterales bacterium]